VKRFDILNEHFPDCSLTIGRLLQDDLAFRELCEDYEDATIALNFWQASPEGSEQRVSGYRDLVVELEAEIAATLRKEELQQRTRLNFV